KGMNMDQLHAQSAAFRQAHLKSEQLRIQIVIFAIGAAFALRSLRTAILFSRENLSIWVITSLFTGIFVIYELRMLRAVNRSIQAGNDLPRILWTTNIVVETCIPALALVFLSSRSIEAAYKPLANPVVLLYFIFIILSTLRLDPAACRIS